MASNFDRWEKDPFFSAAEEVQESADRMESTYRTWIHVKKDYSGTWNSEEIRRDLRTALGTTKWQLEEFERAVRPCYADSSAKDAKERHKEFIIAIESQISKIESALHNSSASDGKPPRPWVHLDEGERDELALFLSRPAINVDKTFVNLNIMPEQSANSLEPDTQSTSDCRNNLLHSPGLKEDKMTGHRRTASASADIGAWKISVSDDVFPQSSNENREPPPRKVPSFSGFLNKMETASKLKWSTNGYRKLKTTDHRPEANNLLPRSHELTRDIKDCYERSNSCLDGSDDGYDKQLYDWNGSIQRMLQRSQYQLQYSQPLKMVLWTVLLVCSLGFLALQAI